MGFSLLSDVAAIFGVALILVASAAAVGSSWMAVLLGNEERRGLAPAIGLGILLVLASLVTAVTHSMLAVAIGLAVVIVVSLVELSWRRRSVLRDVPAALGVTALALALSGLPFLASGRVGLLGVGVNNDMAAHTYWSLHLLERGALPPEASGNGYPTAPHVLVSALMRLTGVAGPELVWMALLVATQLTLAIAAWSTLPKTRWWLRIPAGALVPFAYLNAAYLAQSAYKEPLAALFVVLAALVVTGRGSLGGRSATFVLTCLAIFGSVGLAGLAWPFGMLGFLALATLVARRTWRRALPRSKRQWVIVVVCMLALAAAIAALAPTLLAQYRTLRALPHEGGNVPTFLPTLEVFGIWLSSDFRVAPANVLRAGALAGAAALLFAWSSYRLVARREFGLVAAAAAALVIHEAASQFQSAYWVAKLLAIAAPVIVLVIVRGLLLEDDATRRSILASRVATVAFMALAFVSTAQVLASATVQGLERTHDLAPIRAKVGSSSTLFLGQDHFARTKLRTLTSSNAFPYSYANAQQIDGVEGKPIALGSLVDFDSIASDSLDRFRFVVAPRSAYASAPPPNWRRVERTRWYDLFERDGTTPERATVDDPDQFLGRLDCAADDDRASWTSALVRPEPRLVRASGWTHRNGATPVVYGTTIVIGPGDTISRSITLPDVDGPWELSMQYQSTVALEVRVDGDEWSVPAEPDTMGQRWRVGTVEGDGRMTLRIHAQSRELGIGAKGATIGQVWLTPTAPGELVPYRRACGREVDWLIAANS